MKRVAAHPLVLMLFSGIYPVVFAAANNWFIVQKHELVVVLLVTPLVAVVVGWVFCGLLRLLTGGLAIFAVGRAAQRRFSGEKARSAVVAMYACLVLAFLLQSTHAELVPQGLVSAGVLVAAMSCFAWLSYVAGTKPLSAFLMILTFLAAAQGFYSYHRVVDGVSSSEWHSSSRAHNDRIRFAVKPDIYLIVMESYQGLESLKRTHEFNGDTVKQGFLGRGFVLYENAFSNYRSTLLSLSSLFAMQHHRNEIAVGVEDGFGCRSVIGGKTYSAVLTILNNNGYDIEFISFDDYCYWTGDAVDRVQAGRNLFKGFEIFRNDALDRVLSRIIAGYSGAVMPQSMLQAAVGRSRVEMFERIDAAASSEKPCFTFFKSHLPGHYMKRWDKIDSDPLHYTAKFDEATEEIAGFVDAIVEKDSSAVIIVVGDHGAWKFREIWAGPGDIQENIRGHGIAASAVSHDLFGAFLAVRWPGGGDPEFPIVSHVNLFRYVFAYLSHSDYPLMTLAEDVSFFPVRSGVAANSPVIWNLVGARDGRALDDWDLAP